MIQIDEGVFLEVYWLRLFVKDCIIGEFGDFCQGWQSFNEVQE